MVKHRTSNIKFDFLEREKNIPRLSMLMLNAHYKTNPQAYVIRKVVVTNKSKLSQLSAPGGGYAVSILKLKVIKKRLSNQDSYSFVKLARILMKF
jgi:hypothetical protein